MSCASANKLTTFKNFGGQNVTLYDIATDAEPRNIVINGITATPSPTSSSPARAATR